MTPAPLDVLVAEDNDVNQMVFEQVLNLAEYSFKIVPNGKLAVATFRVRQPRLILMDISMPELNGIEATREIREIEIGLGTRTPILAVTAHALKGDREEFLSAGMDDYVSKPVSPDALLEKVEHWLRSGRIQQVAS